MAIASWTQWQAQTRQVRDKFKIPSSEARDRFSTCLRHNYSSISLVSNVKYHTASLEVVSPAGPELLCFAPLIRLRPPLNPHYGLFYLPRYLGTEWEAKWGLRVELAHCGETHSCLLN